MFSTDPDCLLRDLDIIQARRPTDCIQFLPIPAEQLMYNPHYDPQYELTYCNGQPGTGVELSVSLTHVHTGAQQLISI